MTPTETAPSSNETYDAFAPYYREYSNKKSRYIEGIDALILSNLPQKTASVLDIGCGDGIRLEELLKRMNHTQAYAVDSSPQMVTLARNNTRANVLAADIGTSDLEKVLPMKFDAVLCLWNVLGHIDGSASRKRAILNMSKTLNKGGRIYLDVSNRHNISHYGLKTVMKNILDDILHPKKDSGTLAYDIPVATDETIKARSHFFNPDELQPLFEGAGLHPIKTVYVNYETGKVAGPWSGSMFYILERKK